jgi:hypothetical protein
MSKKFLSILKFVIGWPLSIIAFLFIFKIIAPNINVISKNLFKVNILYLFFAILSFFVYFLLRSFLWKQIVDLKNNKLNLQKISYIWAFSELKRYIPGNIWSILARGSSTLETGLEKKSVANSLIIEIELIVSACYVLSIPFIFYFSWGAIFSYLLLAIGVILILFFVFGNKIGKFSFLFSRTNSSENTKIFLVSLVTFFMFGVGTFFAIISLFYLDIGLIWIVVSLSVFSLLAGYVSLITPMGLGVREGIMTLYLSRFMSASSAGIVSIFYMFFPGIKLKKNILCELEIS